MDTREEATDLLETLNHLAPFLTPVRISLTVGERQLWAVRVSPQSSLSTTIYFCSKGWWYLMREDEAQKIDGLEWKQGQFWEAVVSIIYISGMATSGAQSGLPSSKRGVRLGISKHLEVLEALSEDRDHERRVRKLAGQFFQQLEEQLP